ncbi:flagellar FlbD family protein [Butyrivibrio sp. WCE2006]|uniref:flagellar FlbD family protein n=1 Tax=Butyrivibrio sp. WCE2006 TaxID=1410611 RepID=UPI0005D21BC2|nr:flagellar FlbD family protein [Butyrivibrio sp. WCE2006]
MIEVTRLDGRIILVNENLIETVESTPDTVVLMANGRKFIVKESLSEIMKRCNERSGVQCEAPLVSTGEMAVQSRISEAMHR